MFRGLEFRPGSELEREDVSPLGWSPKRLGLGSFLGREVRRRVWRFGAMGPCR